MQARISSNMDGTYPEIVAILGLIDVVTRYLTFLYWRGIIRGYRLCELN